METNRPYKIYSKNDIKRYLNGDMSSAEMYALEKQAIEDPFLQDAIEGYNSISLEAANHDLDWLQKQFNQNEEAKVISIQEKPRVKAFPWMKIGIAASLVGILFFVGARLLKNDKEEKEIVQKGPEKTEVNKENNTGLTTSDSITNNGLTTTTPNTEINKTTPSSTIGGTPQKVYVKPEDLTDYYSVKDNNIPIQDSKPDYKLETSVAAKREELKKDSLPVKTNGVDDVVVAAPSAPIEKKEVLTQGGETRSNSVVNGNASNNNVSNEIVFDKRAQQNNRSNNNDLARQKTDAEADKLISARSYSFNYTVVDENGNSIPFTNISVPADQLVTYSRVDGKFGLFSSDSVLNVNFKAAGYVPQNIQLANNNKGRIIMQPANANMNEVVVTSTKPALAKKSGKLKSVIEEAEPIDGASNYEHYVANNINTTQKPQGEVILSFEVGDNGEPTNIVVNKSLSAAADQEAIRLLTQGPKWKSAKKKSKKGKIVIKF